MSTITRKPVPSSVAPNAPQVHNAPAEPPMWMKEVEKAESQEDLRRTSTEIQLPVPPPPSYQRRVNIFGKSVAIPGVSKLSSHTFGQGTSRRRTYFGLGKKKFWIIVAAILLILLALIIGLSVGLKKKSGSQNLPLPNNQEVHTGDLTYYAPALGACGFTNSDADNIVAVSHLIFDAVQVGSNPNTNPLCGKKIRASRYNEKAGEQRSVDLTVVDRCTGCAAKDIDVTISVFDQLADRDAGRVLTEWAWLDISLDM